MAILDFLGVRSKSDAPTSQASIKSQLAPAVMDSPFNTSFGGFNNYNAAIARQDAISVPTIARCRSLICNTIAGIPMQMYSTKTGEELPNLLWVDQPDKRQPRSVTIAWLCDSLMMYGVAYLIVKSVFQDDNRPASFEWVQNDRVTPKYNSLGTEILFYTLDGGNRLPMSGVGSLVTFQSLDQGLLIKSANTIKSALDVERAAAVAAQTPMATGYISNSGADLPDAQVQGILSAWKTARQNRATAYLTSTLSYTPVSFSPKEMLYNEAKAYFALELSRACNVSADMVDAEVQKSMTYQNVLERRKEFMAYTLAPYICAIEDRFSMDDLCARGTKIKFQVDQTYLRADATARLAVIEKLLSLGLITIEQAMEMEDLTPEGSESENATEL